LPSSSSYSAVPRCLSFSSFLLRIATREPWTHFKKWLAAPPAFSRAALFYISIEHVSGCCAPRTPTHALKSAARLPRVAFPGQSRKVDNVRHRTNFLYRRVARRILADRPRRSHQAGILQADACARLGEFYERRHHRSARSGGDRPIIQRR
jgi:hypothetical protein